MWMLYILVFKGTDLSGEQEVMSLLEQHDDQMLIKVRMAASLCLFISQDLKGHFNIYLETFQS